MKKRLSAKSIVFMVIGVVVLIAAIIIISYLAKVNRIFADTTSGITYQRLGPKQLFTYGVEKVGPPGDTMGWWKIASGNQSGSGRVEAPQVDSGVAGTVWNGAVSIYPYYWVTGNNVRYEICASNSFYNLMPETLPKHPELCKSYAFNVGSMNPWSYEFKPQGEPAVGRYAKIRLYLMGHSWNSPQIAVYHSVEYTTLTYSGLVDVSDTNITLDTEFVDELGDTISHLKMMPPAASALEEMAAEYRKLTGDPLPFTSMYRSTQAQAYLHRHPDIYDHPAEPCKSWHEAGLAGDLKLAIDSPGGISNDNYEKIIKNLTQKYGFAIDNPNLGQAEDHHINFMPGVQYFNYDQPAAINAAVGSSVCPQ